MSRTSIARFLPWSRRRERQLQHRLEALRKRDGDNCRRCRRPMRFDLPLGHDQGPAFEPIAPGAAKATLDNLCLCHGRCNTEAGDNTAEVLQRVQSRRGDEDLIAAE